MFEVEVINGALVPNQDVRDAVRELAKFQVEAQAMKNKETLLKRTIDEAFKNSGLDPHSITFAGANFVYRKPSVRKTIDAKRLRADLPNIAEQYTKETVTDGSWSVNYSPVGD